MGDRFHSRDVAHDLRLLHDQPGVRDGEAVQEVHQDDDDEEDEGDEEGKGKPGQFRVRVDGDVRELKFANKHGDRLDQARPRPVKVNVVVIARYETREVLFKLFDFWSNKYTIQFVQSEASHCQFMLQNKTDLSL